MVIVHEIRDDDEEFVAQLVRNDSINDFTTDDERDFEEGEEEDEEEDEEEVDTKNSPMKFLSSFIPLRIRTRLSLWSERALIASISLAKFTGKAAWIITTSVLLVGLPLLYAYDREKSLVDYEKEQQRFAPPIKSD